MNSKLLRFFCGALILISCEKQSVPEPRPADIPTLFRTVTIDSNNNVYRLTNYSAQGQVKSDSLFDSDGQRLVIGAFYTYNSTGKVQTTELYYPTIYASGYHWRYEYTYNDTLLARRDVFLKGRFTNYSTYTYSNSKKELTDSLFGNSGTAYANDGFRRMMCKINCRHTLPLV